MSELTPSALRWLAEHHGVITTGQMQKRGVGRKTRMRLIEEGVLSRRYKGVFAITSTPPSLHQRCVALCGAHRAGFVTGPTAGTLLGLRRMPASASIHFSLRHGAKVPAVPGVHFRQTTALRDGDRRFRDDGITIASWARLAFDLAADLRAIDHLSVLNQLLHDGSVEIDELVAAGKRLAHPARRGTTTFLSNLARLGGGPLESHPEVVLADALRRRNIPIEHQWQVARLPDGRTVRIDLAVPAIRWGIELDIHPEHLTLDGGATDARRNRQVHMVGWQIEPVTEADMGDLEHLADELASLYHLRRRSAEASDRRVS